MFITYSELFTNIGGRPAAPDVTLGKFVHLGRATNPLFLAPSLVKFLFHEPIRKEIKTLIV